MDPRWLSIGEIYHSALPIPRSERAAFVRSASGDDDDLHDEVITLLQADESAGDFLEKAMFDLGLKVVLERSFRSAETLRIYGINLDALVGKIVGNRYLVERELGHGGMAAVYLAHDLKLHNRAVVVKVLLEKSLMDEWVVQKFQQEKEALARMDHPGVVGILDTGELPNGKLFIVMQYIDGISLRDAIRADLEGMELERIATIIQQTGAALKAVHDRNIYHRDLKPENIMLHRLGHGHEQVKILDFGIAKVKKSLVAPSTITGHGAIGTFAYISPEQLRGERVTATTDVYSLAVIAYEMVTGRRPFNAETLVQLAEIQRQGVRVKPKDLRPRLPEAAQSIILQGLAFEQKARHQCAAAFGDELAQALMIDELIKRPRDYDGEVRQPQLSQNPTQPDPPTITQPIRSKAIPFDPNQQRLLQQPILPVERKSGRPHWAMMVGMLALVAMLLTGGFFLVWRQGWLAAGNISPSDKSGGGGSLPQRSVSYWLTVQKMRDGNTYQAPFQSSGQEIFETGYRFRLHVSTSESGYLYVFNEGADDETGLSLTVIHPTPVSNKGSAKIEGNEPLQTSWNTFAGQAGTEQFWIVWSSSPITQLEAARDAAFRNGEGSLTDAAMARTVKEFLTQHSDPKLETTKDTANQQTTVRGSGNVLVKLLELEHR